MKRFRGIPRVVRRPEFPGLHRIPWDLVLDYLLEERTDLDETTSAGLETLSRLANCKSALRECLHYRICASLRTVRQMTDRFIRDRVTRLDAHPNIILRGRLWHAYERDNDDPENMHVRLAENLHAQQWRIQQMARRVTWRGGYRNGRNFAAMVVRAFLSQDLLDINLTLQDLERQLDRILRD